jgi:DUF1680 family protein
VNRKKVSDPKIERGYCVLSREWKTGDRVELNLPMPVQRIAANPNVEADRGLLALQRGPIIYCVEQCDQTEPVASLSLPAAAGLKAERNAALPGGMIVLNGTADTAVGPGWEGKLYQPVPATRRVPITAIPYFAWDNRAAGPMKIWLPVAPAGPSLP